MNGIKLFKKFLMPCGLCAAVPVVKPSNLPPDCPEPCNLDEKKLIRPSELPIYSGNEACSKQTPCPEDNCAPSYLEEGFGTIRKTLTSVLTEYSVIVDTVSDKVNTGRAHSEFMLEYLKEETNVLPRLGAISIGGLTGLVLGLRGGKFKRLIYSSTGALTVAAVCYPKQAQEGVELAKHYANIGYNFVYGVKPGDDNQLQIQWPALPSLKLPSSFSEIVDLGVETGAAIGSLASVATDFFKDKEAEASGDKPKQS